MAETAGADSFVPSEIVQKIVLTRGGHDFDDLTVSELAEFANIYSMGYAQLAETIDQITSGEFTQEFTNEVLLNQLKADMFEAEASANVLRFSLRERRGSTNRFCDKEAKSTRFPGAYST